MTQSLPAVRRRSLVAAIGLALATSSAHAATFNVTTNADSGAGSLREALTQADQSAGPHTIDFSSIAGQTITLASDLPDFSEDLTLQGSEVTLDGAGANRCIASRGGDLIVDSMTITGCVASPAGGIIGQASDRGIGFSPPPDYLGGGILVDNADAQIINSTITGNSAYDEENMLYGRGGGVAVKYGDLQVVGSTIRGNSAYVGGGIHVEGFATISDSVIEDNDSVKYGGGIGSVLPFSGPQIQQRGIQASLYLDGTTVSGNSSESGGGAFVAGVVSVNDSEISGNSAYGGGGVLAFVPPDYAVPPHQIIDSTIAGNTATYIFGGLGLFGGSAISGSTISGNTAGDIVGGAILYAKYESDSISLENSTVSGNTAGEGAGLAIYGFNYDDSPTQISLTGVTVSGNTASNGGGGGVLAFSDIGEVPFDFGNSMIAGNSAAEGSADVSAGGSRELRSSRLNWRDWWSDHTGRESRGIAPSTSVLNFSFSLLGEAPDSGTFNPDATTTELLGADPQIGPLADNGGPTFTHLPQAGSPAINAIPSGSGGCGSTFNIDQRGQSRPQGDDCDIGSVEIEGLPEAAPALPVPVLDRIGLLILALGAGLLGLLGMRRRQQG